MSMTVIRSVDPGSPAHKAGVRIGETLVRVIANGYEYQNLKEGQQVRLSIRDMMVFEDDGTLEQMLEIRT